MTAKAMWSEFGSATMSAQEIVASIGDGVSEALATPQKVQGSFWCREVWQADREAEEQWLAANIDAARASGRALVPMSVMLILRASR